MAFVLALVALAAAIAVGFCTVALIVCAVQLSLRLYRDNWLNFLIATGGGWVAAVLTLIVIIATSQQHTPY